jgi:hypothetical protein
MIDQKCPARRFLLWWTCLIWFHESSWSIKGLSSVSSSILIFAYFGYNWQFQIHICICHIRPSSRISNEYQNTFKYISLLPKILKNKAKFYFIFWSIIFFNSVILELGIFIIVLSFYMTRICQNYFKNYWF